MLEGPFGGSWDIKMETLPNVPLRSPEWKSTYQSLCVVRLAHLREPQLGKDSGGCHFIKVSDDKQKQGAWSYCGEGGAPMCIHHKCQSFCPSHNGLGAGTGPQQLLQLTPMEALCRGGQAAMQRSLTTVLDRAWGAACHHSLRSAAALTPLWWQTAQPCHLPSLCLGHGFLKSIDLLPAVYN